MIKFAKATVTKQQKWYFNSIKRLESSSSSNLPNLTAEQLKKIEVKDKHYRNQHVAFDSSLGSSEKDEVRRRRIIYRSKQRGWLEVDILLGTWAVENVNKLNKKDLDDYELLLNQETVDIYNFINGLSKPPAYIVDTPVFKKIQLYAQGITSKTSTPDSYAAIKRRTNLT